MGAERIDDPRVAVALSRFRLTTRMESQDDLDRLDSMGIMHEGLHVCVRAYHCGKQLPRGRVGVADVKGSRDFGTYNFDEIVLATVRRRARQMKPVANQTR